MNHLKTGNSYFAQGSYKSNKYNGKELQETGMYSYGWREYMPDIAKWNGIDQLAESYVSASPYAYVMNNPINMFDPDGRKNEAWLEEAPAWLQETWNNTPDGTNSYWTNSGSSSGGGGGHFVYTGGTAGLTAGYGIGSTVDYAGNFNSYYGTVTNGVLNYTYWTNGAPASGYTNSGGQNYQNLQGIVGHSGKLNLNSTPLDAYKNWADWGSSVAGGGFKYLADQRTALYNSGYWIDNLGTMRSVAYAGRSRGSLIGLRSDYVRTTTMYGKYAKGAGYVGYAISAGQIGYGMYKDGGKFGVKAQVATANVAGGMAGAAVGAWVVGKAGGEIGALVGVWFEGVGAIPGGAIGAAIGGIIGGIVGGVYGGDYAEEWASGKLNKATPIKQ